MSGTEEKKIAVWKYFVKENSQSAKCSLCGKVLMISGRSTTELTVHLKSIHKIDTKAQSGEQFRVKYKLDVSELIIKLIMTMKYMSS